MPVGPLGVFLSITARRRSQCPQAWGVPAAKLPRHRGPGQGPQRRLLRWVGERDGSGQELDNPQTTAAVSLRPKEQP